MTIVRCFSAVLALFCAAPGHADPATDARELRAYFHERFPALHPDDYADGVYAIDAGARAEWRAIEVFPPYEFNVEHGKKLFDTPFKDGSYYKDCLMQGGVGTRQQYPRFDSRTGTVVTLESAVNACRTQHGEPALPDDKGDLADISAYLAHTARGKRFDIHIPEDPRARAAYETGKAFYYAKRGQLNLSCADCHIQNAGRRLRAERLSPLLGQPTHFPVYRSAWGYLGTLHHRYRGCMEQVRAQPLAAQSPEFRALEYFQTYLSNGLPVNGPASRK